MKQRLAIAAAVALLALSACKTTEENYRAAYEKTMEARSEAAAIDSTIYGVHRRQMGTQSVQTAQGPVEVRTQLVRVTDGGGGIAENLKRYCLVVGQFKMLFNAKSLRERLVDLGYPSAFVVETAEPFYYIVLNSYSDVDQAARELEAFKAAAPIALKEPCPFILDATAHRTGVKGRRR